MKNVLKRLMAVVLTVSTLTALFCINSSAVTKFSHIYSSNNVNVIWVKLENNSGSGALAMAEAKIKLSNFTNCNFSVVGAGIIGKKYNTEDVYNTYLPKKNQYISKHLSEDKFTVNMTTNWQSNIEDTALEPFIVNPEKCGVVFIAGKWSNTSSSTYNYSFLEFDSSTNLPYQTYFSNVVGNYLEFNW